MNHTKVINSTVLLVSNNGMGNAEAQLQLKLIGTYLNLLLENDELPAAICFYTEGVRLAVEGSPVLAQLQSLEDLGVRLILCSTCLNYFELVDKVKVGIVGSMSDIIEAQWKSEKVISI